MIRQVFPSFEANGSARADRSEKQDENKRYTYLFLTSAGEAELATLLLEKEKFQNGALEAFSEEEVSALLKSVTKMMNNVEKMEEK